jgi:hypothetical protein
VAHQKRKDTTEVLPTSTGNHMFGDGLIYYYYFLFFKVNKNLLMCDKDKRMVDNEAIFIHFKEVTKKTKARVSKALNLIQILRKDLII